MKILRTLASCAWGAAFGVSCANIWLGKEAWWGLVLGLVGLWIGLVIIDEVVVTPWGERRVRYKAPQG